MYSSNDIVQKTYFGQNLTFQSAPVTLKIRSRSPKSNQPFSFSQPCCEFGQNPSTGSEDTAWKRYFRHFKVPL